MLQPPPLIDPPRNSPLAQARQVRRMVHAHLDTMCSKLLHQRRQQRGTGLPRRLACPPQGVGEDAQLELRVPPEGIA